MELAAIKNDWQFTPIEDCFQLIPVQFFVRSLEQ